jgi:hypothetical protein
LKPNNDISSFPKSILHIVSSMGHLLVWSQFLKKNLLIREVKQFEKVNHKLTLQSKVMEGLIRKVANVLLPSKPYIFSLQLKKKCYYKKKHINVTRGICHGNIFQGDKTIVATHAFVGLKDFVFDSL